MKHISHCEFSWSWSLDPREENSPTMRLWEIYLSQLTSSLLLVPLRCRQKQRNLPTGGEVDEGMVLCQICFIPTCVASLNCFTRQCTDEKIQWGRWWPRNARCEGGGDSTTVAALNIGDCDRDMWWWWCTYYIIIFIISYWHPKASETRNLTKSVDCWVFF